MGFRRTLRLLLSSSTLTSASAILTMVGDLSMLLVLHAGSSMITVTYVRVLQALVALLLLFLLL